jgi:6-phospho-beta-glucosidase
MGDLKISVIGGGSTYTPELIEGLIHGQDDLPVSDVTLMDIDEERLSIVGGLADRMLRAAAADIRLQLTTNCKEAIEPADYVITQIRVGGLACRIQDEKIPLQFGVIGQETTGPGGFAKALRTIPVVLDIARDISELAPHARLINFTNPSGIITEALLKHTAVPTIGLCNSPVGFQRDIAGRLNVAPERVQLDYVGLNHLSWIRGVSLDGEDVLGQVLAGAVDLARAGESPFSPDLLEALEMLPSYYLRYYYDHDQVLAEQRQAEKTRGQVVQDVEARLLELYADPDVRSKPDLLEKRGGAHYSTAALAVIRAVHQDTGQVQIVNTRNDGALPDLPPDVVVELRSRIDSSGAQALPVAPMPPAIRGLTQAVKAYEQLTIRAGVEGDEQAAVQALLAHPLVPSFAAAQGLWAAIKQANRAHLPQFDLD